MREKQRESNEQREGAGEITALTSERSVFCRIFFTLFMDSLVGVVIYY